MDVKRLLSRFAFFAVVLASGVLLVRVLPLPGSPLFLGASIAVVYWLVRARVSPDED